VVSIVVSKVFSFIALDLIKKLVFISYYQFVPFKIATRKGKTS